MFMTFAFVKYRSCRSALSESPAQTGQLPGLRVVCKEDILRAILNAKLLSSILIKLKSIISFSNNWRVDCHSPNSPAPQPANPKLDLPHRDK